VRKDPLLEKTGKTEKIPKTPELRTMTGYRRGREGDHNADKKERNAKEQSSRKTKE